MTRTHIDLNEQSDLPLSEENLQRLGDNSVVDDLHRHLYASYCSLMVLLDTTFGNRHRLDSLLPIVLTGGSAPGGSKRHWF